MNFEKSHCCLSLEGVMQVARYTVVGVSSFQTAVRWGTIQFVLPNLCCYLGGFSKPMLMWFMKQTVNFCWYLSVPTSGADVVTILTLPSLTSASLKVHVACLTKRSVSLVSIVLRWSVCCSEIEERWGNLTHTYIFWGVYIYMYVCVCIGSGEWFTKLLYDNRKYHRSFSGQIFVFLRKFLKEASSADKFPAVCP